MEQNCSWPPCPSVARLLPKATRSPEAGIWVLHCTEVQAGVRAGGLYGPTRTKAGIQAGRRLRVFVNETST